MVSERLERDGKVAVLYSSGYGAGWSTWSNYGENVSSEEKIFDRDIAELVEKGDHKGSEELAKQKYPKAYLGGFPLDLEWVPKGTRIFIHEYDGYESVWTIDDTFGYIA